MTVVMRHMNIDAVLQGFRATFKDWAGEQINSPREAAEQVIAHTLESQVKVWRSAGEALPDDARVGRIYFAKSINLVNLIRHLLTCEVSFLTKEDNALVIHQFRSTHTKTSNLDLIKYFQNRATRFSIQTYNLIIPLIPGRRKEIRQIKIQSFFQCQINLLYK